MDQQCIINFPLIIKWNITSRCNLRCRHCFLSSYVQEPDLMKLNQIIEGLGRKKVAAICLTGGEPLLRNDLEEIVESLNKSKIKTMVATNGSLLTNDRIDQLIKSGLNIYQISLDGHNEHTHDYYRGEGIFHKVITAINELKSRGASVILAHTLNKLNYIHLEKIIELAENLQVDALRFELFIPLGNGKNNEDQLALDESSLKFIKDTLFNVKNNKVQIEFPTFNSEYGCGAGIFNCVINSDFTLSPCDMLTELYRTEPFNNINELEELWKSSNIFNEWRQLKTTDNNCNNCNYKSKCNYGCRASSLGYSNDIKGVDILCINRIGGKNG